jgi:hypothetical protein
MLSLTDLAEAISFVLQGRDVSASRAMFLNSQPRRRFRSRVAPRRSTYAQS